MNPKLINIEIAFATPQLQKIISVVIRPDTSIIKAIQLSQIAKIFPEYNFNTLPVGVFGKRIFDPLAYQFKPGDRLEIYRPLDKTPNQKRLERAQQK